MVRPRPRAGKVHAGRPSGCVLKTAEIVECGSVAAAPRSLLPSVRINIHRAPIFLTYASATGTLGRSKPVKSSTRTRTFGPKKFRFFVPKIRFPVYTRRLLSILRSIMWRVTKTNNNVFLRPAVRTHRGVLFEPNVSGDGRVVFVCAYGWKPTFAPVRFAAAKTGNGSDVYSSPYRPICCCVR